MRNQRAAEVLFAAVRTMYGRSKLAQRMLAGLVCSSDLKSECAKPCSASFAWIRLVKLIWSSSSLATCKLGLASLGRCPCHAYAALKSLLCRIIFAVVLGQNACRTARQLSLD